MVKIVHKIGPVKVIEPVVTAQNDYGVPWAGFSMQPEELQHHIAVPVRDAPTGTILDPFREEGWNRTLVIRPDAELADPYLPIVVSAREAWRLNDGAIEIYEKAVVLDGAQRLEDSLQLDLGELVPVLALFELDETAERAFRNTAREQATEGKAIESLDNSKRITLDTEAKVLMLNSDPFLAWTAFGYTAAVYVTDCASGDAGHIFLGAGSLAKPIEALRLDYGTLVGLRLEVKKLGPKKSDPYGVQRVER